MKTYTITSEADTRSKTRRTRTWDIQAENLEDARYEARMRHLTVVGWNSSIATELVAVDGTPTVDPLWEQIR